MADTIYMLTQTWSPRRRVVFGKRTWTYQRVFYTTDRDTAREMYREAQADVRGSRFPDHKVACRPQTTTYGYPLDAWSKRKFRDNKTVKGWR